MNIKHIKKLKELKVYPKGYSTQNGIFEDKEVMEQCMPYNFFPIPTIQELSDFIISYSPLKIEGNFSEMGFNYFTVKVNVGTEDTVEEKFTSPFLDDALSEALIALKENANVREKAVKEFDKLDQSKG